MNDSLRYSILNTVLLIPQRGEEVRYVLGTLVRTSVCTLLRTVLSALPRANNDKPTE